VVEPEDPDRSWRYRWRWTHSGGTVATPRPATGRAAPAPIVLEESDEARVLLDPRGRFVNVVLPPLVAEEFWTGSWEQEKGIGISRILYRSLQDVFDFVFMSFPADEPVDTEPAAALATRTRLHTTGLGLRDRDRTASFGSDGRLMGMIVMSSHEYIDSSIPSHEITHLWGQRLVTASSNPRVPGHMGFMEEGGYLGGWYPGTLEEAGGGLWLARDPYGGSDDRAPAIIPTRPSSYT